jgi:hypothetical protein
MCHKSFQLGMLALVLALSAAAAAQTSGPPPANAFAQDNASPQNSPQYNPLTPRDASPQTNARPTPAQLDQPGAVVTPPPILRNAGKTVVQPDQPLMGRLNLHGQRPQGSLSDVPAMEPSPNEAATSSGAGNADAPRRGYY